MSGLSKFDCIKLRTGKGKVKMSSAFLNYSYPMNNDTSSATQGRSPWWMSDICLLYNLIIRGIMCFTIMLFGVSSNILTMLTLWDERKASTTSYLLTSLASVDTLNLLVLAWMNAVPQFCNNKWFHWDTCHTLRRKYWETFKTQGWALFTFFNLISLYIVILIAFQRYLAVCKPLRVKTLASMKNIKFAILFVVILSFVTNLPMAIEEKVYFDEERGRYRSERQGFANSWWYSDFYATIIFTYILIYIIPVVSLSILSFFLLRSLRTADQSRKQMVNQGQLKPQNKNVTITLLAVIMTCAVCEFPGIILLLLKEVFDLGDFSECESIVFYFTGLNSMLVMVNSSANFVIYMTSSEAFRMKLKTKFLRKKAGESKMFSDIKTEINPREISLESTQTITDHNTYGGGQKSLNDA